MTVINSASARPRAVEMKLRHPVTNEHKFDVEDEEGNVTWVEGIFIVAGYFSKEFYKASKEMMKKRSEMTTTAITEDFLETETVELLANCVVGWVDTGLFSEPYSKENVRELLGNPENRWIVEQLLEFLADRTRFFGKPSNS